MRMASLRAALTPPLDRRTSVTAHEPMRSTISALPSVDPSSTTIISRGCCVWHNTERSVAPISAALLYNGITTDMSRAT